MGAIQTLERAGHHIDYVAGSGMGAWVGAWLALGMDSEGIEHTLRSEFTEDVGHALFRAGAAGTPSGAAAMAELADVPVTPTFGPGTWRDFQLGDQCIAAGAEAMEAALPRLRTFARPRPR